MPTALERAGDFSQTLDNNGALFNFIKDPALTGACSATDQTACFRDGGVLGKIPANRLYSVGPRDPEPLSDAQSRRRRRERNYNYELGGAGSAAPARGSAAASSRRCASTTSCRRSCASPAPTGGERQRVLTTPGLIPGFTDVLFPYPFITKYSVTANYMLTPTTFLEGTYGFIRNELAGGNENGILMNESANRLNGLAALPAPVSRRRPRPERLVRLRGPGGHSSRPSGTARG